MHGDGRALGLQRAAECVLDRNSSSTTAFGPAIWAYAPCRPVRLRVVFTQHRNEQPWITFVAFDLLVLDDENLCERPYR